MTETSPGEAAETPRENPPSDEPLCPLDDLLHYLREYARQNPEKAALWCLGVGFILGWKLKPW